MVSIYLAEVDLGALAEGLPRMADWATRAWPPSTADLGLLLLRAAETFAIALVGTTLAAVMALGTCSLAARNITTSGFLRLPMRWLLNTLSSLHQIDLATRYADRIIGLRAGRVVVDTPVESFGAAGYAPSSAPRLPSPRSPPALRPTICAACPSRCPRMRQPLVCRR